MINIAAQLMLQVVYLKNKDVLSQRFSDFRRCLSYQTFLSTFFYKHTYNSIQNKNKILRLNSVIYV